MKVVLDTNVLISGIFFGGPPGHLLAAWQAGQFELVLSPDILDEYLRVAESLAEHHPDIDISPILRLIVARGTLIEVAPLPQQVCSDPSDDKFLACALAGAADVIVSGDHQLQAVSGYQGIAVIPPQQFIADRLA